MRTCKVLAIDPGPRLMGWARLTASFEPGARVEYRAGNECDCAIEPFGALLDALVYGNEEADEALVVVERPAGYAFQPARVPGLLDTAFAAGGMAWLAERRGANVRVLTAQQVRKVLAGKGNADDAQVREVVRRNVFGAGGVTSSHVADAVAAGLLGVWVHAGRAVLPPVVSKARKAGTS